MVIGTMALASSTSQSSTSVLPQSASLVRHSDFHTQPQSLFRRGRKHSHKKGSHKKSGHKGHQSQSTVGDSGMDATGAPPTGTTAEQLV
ncbi:hypothetical protein H4R33_004836 [Dimargaris cristalligena]|nr:hypothetical protein H4R33_004836 [Dimargaris cristalligena]